MVDVNPVVGTKNIYEVGKSSLAGDSTEDKLAVTKLGSSHNDLKTEVSRKDIEIAAADVERVVNEATKDTNLSFRIEEDLSRMVVSVRAVGSDEIIRQFPPEEFITVAKFIASQTPDMVDEDFLKGVLFDQYS
jgi:uncharacterized FlaG/YvyC family protein